MNAQMHTTPSSMPALAVTANSPPLSRPRKNSTGPVIHGRPISKPPTVGPQRRAASDMAATRIGGTATLRRKNITAQASGEALSEEARDLLARPIRDLAVREVAGTRERRQVEVGEELAQPVAPDVAQHRVEFAPAHAGRHIDGGK